jgi:hypothetical protein
MTICAWCDRVIKPGRPSFVTHGICPTCQVAFVGGAGPVSLSEFIAKFKFPVIVVGPDAELIEANRRAGRMLGKDPSAIRGQLAGEVLECIYACQPGGCGRHVHCKACAIRNSVTDTHRTGTPLVDVDSYQEIMTKDGLKRVHLKITTVKRADSVLLKIVAA